MTAYRDTHQKLQEEKARYDRNQLMTSSIYYSQMNAHADAYGGTEGQEMRQEWADAKTYDTTCGLGHKAIYRPAVGMWCLETDGPKAVCDQQS